MGTTTECPQGQQNPVFDIHKCQVPCIFPVPQGTWGDFWLPQSPQAIYDFEYTPVPIAPDVPCPTITIGNQSGNQNTGILQ